MDDEAAPGSGRVLKALAVLVVVLFAFFAGMLVERLRFDAQRSDMLKRWDHALREYQERLMQSEKQSEKTATR